MNSPEVKYLKGVGDIRSKILAEHFDIHTFADLLGYFPMRHADRSRFYQIAELQGEMPEVQLLGRFVRFYTEGEGRHQRLKGVFTDGHRMMETVWFSKIPYFSKAYQIGAEYVIFGKPQPFNGIYSISHPEVTAYDPSNPPGGFQGVYSIPDVARKRGITSQWLRKIIESLLASEWFSRLPETLPREIVEKMHLMSYREAVMHMHAPSSPALLRKASERLKFEELFYLEMNILRYSRNRNRQIQGHVFNRIGDYFNNYYNRCLPFELTGAQKRVIKEIRNDMRTGRQMNRLLQGDVGCGKTLVAFMTLLIGLDNGFQGCMMAPTEILASQHYETLRQWCGQIGVEVRLLTGSTRVRERREIAAGIADGSVQILVGTHALIEETVKFARLGVAVIDEQHRFGVAQRAKIWEKGTVPPHVLVMTATPIPRTLAMTVYGDLEVSVIDELPPGRKPVTTLLYPAESRRELNNLVYRELMKGHQAYFVYPLIKENEKLSLKSLEEGYEQVCDTFRDFRVSMVHGQLKPEEKEYQMQLFVTGQAEIMVATTVIEVGVNVPNASVMVIENAERFGLSQLHQLRGRVGRGAEQSYCLLTSSAKGGDSRKRLDIMTETTDGFVLSEADMKLRGPGDMEGTQQSGLPFSLKVANLVTDGQIIKIARDMAMAVIDGEMPLDSASQSLVAAEMQHRFAKEKDWSRIS